MLKTIALSPLILTQAVWVATRAARLPEAAGPREGRLGTGPLLRILLLGDSSVAGVGVAHQDQALAGQLTAILAKERTVQWRVIAKSGATAASMLDLIATERAQRFDLAVIGLGVNDTKNGVALSAWRQRITDLLDLVDQMFGVDHTLISGLPPVRHFPLLPWPLKSVLGDRAEVFDAALQDIANSRANTTHLPLDVTLDTDLMSSDGFHPGPMIYAEWARLAAERVDRDMVTPD